MIDVRNVYKTFYSRHKVEALVDVSLQVDKGEVVTIIGPSGSGKSTLLRCLNHLETIDKGEIIIDGIPLTDSKTNMYLIITILLLENQPPANAEVRHNIFRGDASFIPYCIREHELVCTCSMESKVFPK